MNQPLISVVIPSYNCGKYVIAAVESALAQTYPVKEVIVVDDGSTDDTRARLAPYESIVRYIHQTNSGVAAARNRGIAEAKGEAIAFLDADDEWLPEKLTRQWEVLEANPAAPLVHTDVVHYYEANQQREYLDSGRHEFTGDCYATLFRGNRLCLSTVLVRRACLAEIGGFDEAICDASTEDYDLWIRIARHYPFCYIAEPLVIYRLHSGNATRKHRIMLEQEYYVLAKSLRNDPSLPAKFGNVAVRERLANVAFNAGYANLEAGDLHRARRYLLTAACYAPHRTRHVLYWLSTCLPRSLRSQLRAWKQQFSSLQALRTR